MACDHPVCVGHPDCNYISALQNPTSPHRPSECLTMDIRKTTFIREIIDAYEMGKPCASNTGVAAMAVVRNPFTAIAQEDLSQLFDVGAELGETLTQKQVQMLSAPPICYGKGPLSDRPALWNMALRCCTQSLVNLCGKPLAAENH